jgi:hypothetical protein
MLAVSFAFFGSEAHAQWEPLAFAICKKIQADTARLKCFDEIGAKSSGGSETAEPQPVRGRWIYTESKSPIDDSPQVSAIMQGDTPEIILVLRCQENKTEAAYLPGQFFFSTSGRVDVLMRLNTESPITISMIPGSNNRSLFIPGAQEFMRLLPDGGKLFFRAKLNSGTQSDATFDLADVSAARDRIADTCHWTTPKTSRPPPPKPIK